MKSQTTDKAGTELATIGEAYPALLGQTNDALRSAMEANLGEGVKLRMWDLDRVKIPSGGSLAWEVTDEDGIPSYPQKLVGIIVYTKRVRSMWFESIEQGGGGSPPDCSSPDALQGYGDPGVACETCQFSKFGNWDGDEWVPDERTQRQRGDDEVDPPPCSLRRAVFILREGQPFPTLLVLPPTSVKVLEKWLRQITMRLKPYWRFVVELSLEKAKNPDNVEYARLVIKPLRALSVEENATVEPFAKATRETFAAYHEGEQLGPDPTGAGEQAPPPPDAPPEASAPA